MTRTQIQLDDETRELLRRRAFEEGKSVSAVAREILVKALHAGTGRGKGAPKTALDLFPFAGIIKDDPENVSENHDDYLFGEDP